MSGIGRPQGAPGQIVSAWLEGKFDLVVSDALLEEFKRVLFYPRIRKLLAGAGLSNEDIQDYVDLLRLKAITVRTDEVVLAVEPTDINDRHVLQTLVASSADYLVTGDKKHLLSLDMNQVVPCADFVGRLQAFKSMQVPLAATRDLLSKIRKKRAVVSRKGERS